MGIYDRDHRQNDPWKKNPQTKTKFKIGNKKTKEYKTISNKIFIYPFIFFLIVAGYRNLNSNEKTQQTQTTYQQPTQQVNTQIITRAPTQAEEQAYMQEHHLIKLGSEYHWYGVKENGEVKPITNALEMNCQNDFCKIENYFNYVKKIPYEKGETNRNKNAIDVLMEGKGDCDERSDLLASLMIQGKYETILIYTKDHTFAGINVPNYNTNERKSYFEYNNKKYYYAETTNINAYVGMYNGIDPKEFKYIYNVNEKKEIPMDQVKAQIYL